MSKGDLTTKRAVVLDKNPEIIKLLNANSFLSKSYNLKLKQSIGNQNRFCYDSKSTSDLSLIGLKFDKAE